MEAVTDAFLTQHVKEATRGTNILDLVFSSEPGMVEGLTVECPIATSDHNVILWRVGCDVVQESGGQRVRSYHKGNYKEINRELEEMDWIGLLSNLQVNEMWKVFLERVLGIRDKYVPEREEKLRGTKNAIWMGRGILRSIKSRDKQWRRFQRSKTFENEKEYKLIRNKVTSKIRNAKRGYEEKIAANIKSDKKSFYAYVRGKNRSKVRVGPLKGEDGGIISDDEGMASVLSSYFAKVFVLEDLGNVPEASEERVKELGVSIGQIDIEEVKVEEIINNLKENKAAGVDELNSTFLKRSVKGLVKPLAMIFRESLRMGEVPEDWKMANVTAIFKKGAKWDPGNYRPVSLTSQVGKILEKIIKDMVTEYLETNELIHNSQHGFRSNKSCLTNLLEFMETISERLDKGELVDVVYLDFRKAFDTVPHVRLRKKLEAMGIRGQVLNWIVEWLRDRRQRVVLRGRESKWEKVVSGVPQGSVLGPVLFTIFINDLDQGLINRILKFADDTKVIGKVTCEEDVKQLREDLQKLVDWSVKWQLDFNVEKCKVMHVGRGNGRERYEMGGKELLVCEVEKDLGVLVSNDGKVTKQCAEAAKKGFMALGMIARAFTTRKKAVIIILYKTIVRPNLEYCIQAWRPHLRKDIDLLERVQRRATKMVQECEGMEYEERLRCLKLTTLETRRIRADLIEVYKIVYGTEGLREDEFFVRGRGGASNSINRARTLRGNVCKLYKKGFKLDIAKYSFGNRVVNLWNKLPDSVILGGGGLDAFKGRLDRFMRHSWGLA